MRASDRAEIDARLEQVAIARRRAPRAARLADDIRTFLDDGKPGAHGITRQEGQELEWLAYSLDACGTFEFGRMVNDIDEALEAEQRARLNAFIARRA